MADENQAPVTEEKDGAMKTIVIVLVIIAIGALGYYLITNNSQPNSANEVVDEVMENVDEARDDAAETVEDVLSSDVVRRLAAFRVVSEKVNALLSEAGQDQLNVVVLYVEKDPTVLVADQTTYPEEVQAAVTEVKTELQTLLSEAAVVAQEKLTAAQQAKLEEEAGKAVAVGDTLVVNGMLEVASEDSPVGTVFMVTDEVVGITYYFVFDAVTTQTLMAEMVNEEVVLEVEVTEVTDEGAFGYVVTSGPVLASEYEAMEAETPTEEEAMTEE